MLLLDCRLKEEFNISHIVGAKQVKDRAQPSTVKVVLEEALQKKIDTVLCYCSIGYRSAKLVTCSQCIGA